MAFLPKVDLGTQRWSYWSTFGERLSQDRQIQMKVGFLPFFGWRPHNQHFLYLMSAVKQLGYRTAVLKCDGSIRTCYNREIKSGILRKIACPSCKLSANYSTYFSDEASNFSAFSGTVKEAPPGATKWAESSYRTLKRIETSRLSGEDRSSQLFTNLRQSSSQTYEIVSSWIREEKIDFVLFFNGRMDITRAALEACKDQGVRFASVERSIFNWGIQVYPGAGCLDLKHPHQITRDYAEVPLNAEAAQFAGSVLATRLFNIHENSTEWRTYNRNRLDSRWPGLGQRRVLLLPSSSNEIEGEPSYQMEWKSPIEGFEAVLDALSLEEDEVVMRGHPNWGEAIGSASGDASNRYYRNWCKERGLAYIPPDSPIDTNSLIRECDLVVLSHSSAAFEATALAKPVINIRSALYTDARISSNMRSDIEISENIDSIRDYLNNGYGNAKLAQRHLLRFLFTMAKRVPLFPDTARPKGAAGVDFYDPRGLDRLERILTDGVLEPAEYEAGSDTRHEDKVLEEITGRTFEAAPLASMFTPETSAFNMPRRFKVTESLRMHFKQGDR